MERTNPPAFDIDSDVLRCLTFLDILQEANGGFVERETVPDPVLQSNFNYYCRILKYIKLGELRVVINDAVYQESKHSKSLVEFMKKYAYFPDVNMHTYQEQAEAASRLAYAYCQPYEIDGEKRPAPMKFVYIADIKKRVPTNDAYAMAYATVGGRCFITANGRDFIFNERTGEDKNYHEISRGIMRINIERGYYSEEESGRFLVPKPIHLTTFGAIIKDGTESLYVPEMLENLVPARDVIPETLDYDEEDTLPGTIST